MHPSLILALEVLASAAVLAVLALPLLFPRAPYGPDDGYVARAPAVAKGVRVPRASRNMAWWRANRPNATAMTRGRWFVVDECAVRAGPCRSLDDAIQAARELACMPGCLIQQLND